MTQSWKPSVPALVVITGSSLAVGFLFSPPDPYSFFLLSVILLALSLSSYVAGLRRGRDTSV